MQKQARKVFAIECDATDITGLRSIGSPKSGEDAIVNGLKMFALNLLVELSDSHLSY